MDNTFKFPYGDGWCQLRLTTEADKHLPAFRFTQLNETATCPTLAALRFGYLEDVQDTKDDEDGPRSMALAAGKACHRVFAAVRLWGLRENHPVLVREGIRLFGEEHFDKMNQAAMKFLAEGELTQRRAFCLEALYTSGFYDDPNDRYRTMANLEQTCLGYIDQWDYEREVFMVPTKVGELTTYNAGIELSFDLVIEFDDGWKARFVGTLDALHYAIGSKMELMVHENKTGRYINDAWARGFQMSHQVTGYCAAATVLANRLVKQAAVFGSQIPMASARPVRVEPVEREVHHFSQWAQWFRWCADTFRAAVDDPIVAPKFTHSCGRFFGECVFIPFCAGDNETKEQIIHQLKNKGDDSYV